jgi:uncharacterized membrane protein YjjB (DUF3815 family)
VNAIVRTVAWFLLIGGAGLVVASALTLNLTFLAAAAACYVAALLIGALAIRSDR